jgi:hypothetical protein
MIALSICCLKRLALIHEREESGAGTGGLLQTPGFWRHVVGLLHRPLLSGVFSHLEVQHTTSSV